MNKLLSVCIVNHNGEELLNRYLPSVVDSLNFAEEIEWELIFCDNGSVDDSVSVVERLCPEAKIIRFPENKGFSESNNAAVRSASGAYVLLLNNDIKPRQDFLKPLLDHLNDPEVFAVAPRIYRFNEELDDGVRNAEFRTGLLTPVLDIRQSLKNEPVLTTFFCGGAVLFRKSIFFELGGFDELFNPYSWEDLDLAYRAWKHGFSIKYVPQSHVYHDRETTAQKIFSLNQRKRIVWRNRFLFMWKNLAFFPHLFEHIIFLPSKLVKFLFTGRAMYVAGFLWAALCIPRVIWRRLQEHRSFKRSDSEIFEMMRCE
ncbi:glycosyltransferase family 2 protein [bacterium]|nr:glycosyltransferase family 2 protein [bacterium]